MPIISIIVPVYNVEPYLHRCIDSILNQTFTDFELILVDDGSPDNCGAICDEYAVKDNRITVIHQKNGGPSAARNAGIDWSFANSDSQWLTFIDSDDWVHPQYLELLYNAVRDNDAKVSCCAYLVTSENIMFQTVSVPEIRNINIKEFYLHSRTNFTVAWGKLYHKNCFCNIRYPIKRIHEDEFITYKILFENDRIPFVGESIYCYYINPNSIMNSKFTLKRYDIIDAFEEKINFFKKHNWYDLVYKTKKEINFTKSWMALESKKEKIYTQVPKKYKINTLKMLISMYYNLGRNRYESIMFQYYPTTIKLQSYYFKIKSLFTSQKNEEN